MQLVGVDQAWERDASGLAGASFRQEVVVLGKERTSKLRGPVKDLRVGRSRAFILLDSEDLDAPEAQTPS